MRSGSAKSTIVTRNAGVTLAIISLANISEGKARTKVQYWRNSLNIPFRWRSESFRYQSLVYSSDFWRNIIVFIYKHDRLECIQRFSTNISNNSVRKSLLRKFVEKEIKLEWNYSEKVSASRICADFNTALSNAWTEKTRIRNWNKPSNVLSMQTPCHPQAPYSTPFTLRLAVSDLGTLEWSRTYPTTTQDCITPQTP